MALPTSFPRLERLLQSSEFTSVFNNTQCKSSDQNFMVLAKSNHRLYPRLGLAITKKKIRMAIARNRLKRIIRESFRHHKEYLNGMDIVVLCQSRAAAVNNDELFSSLHNHWLKIAERCKN
jgi:ribonuclease P protein component